MARAKPRFGFLQCLQDDRSLALQILDSVGFAYISDRIEITPTDLRAGRIFLRPRFGSDRFGRGDLKRQRPDLLVDNRALIAGRAANDTRLRLKFSHALIGCANGSGQFIHAALIEDRLPFRRADLVADLGVEIGSSKGIGDFRRLARIGRGIADNDDVGQPVAAGRQARIDRAGRDIKPRVRAEFGAVRVDQRRGEFGIVQQVEPGDDLARHVERIDHRHFCLDRFTRQLGLRLILRAGQRIAAGVDLDTGDRLICRRDAQRHHDADDRHAQRYQRQRKEPAPHHIPDRTQHVAKPRLITRRTCHLHTDPNPSRSNGKVIFPRPLSYVQILRDTPPETRNWSNGLLKAMPLGVLEP